MIPTSVTRATVVAMVTVLTASSCQQIVRTSTQQTSSPAEHAAAQTPGLLPSLGDAQNKLEDVITQPSTTFRLRYSKSVSGGYSFWYDVEVSPTGIQGKEKLVRSQASASPDAGKTAEVRELNGTPIGSNSWRFIANDLLTSFGSDLQYAEPGLRYVGEESKGGFETRRYDFDLAHVPVADKTTPIHAGLVDKSSRSEEPKYHSLKGTAWIAKEDGRLVNVRYDHITTFADGTRVSIHYDLSITRE